MSETPRVFRVDEIARRVDGRLDGPTDLVVRGVNSIADARSDEITFAHDDWHARALAKSAAAAVVCSERVSLDGVKAVPRAIIRVADAELATIILLRMFAQPEVEHQAGVHETAAIDASAGIAPTASIGPHVTVEAGAHIGDGVVLHAGARVGREASIDDETVIWHNAVVRDRCRVGKRCIIHPNASIGADGFGFRPSPDESELLKMPHIGHVELGDDVEVGSNTCIDRGKFGATKVGSGTKIDNLVQIAHNCRIGRRCIIAGLTGIAGSTVIGDHVIVGASSRILEHLTIGAGARIAGASIVISSVEPGATIVGIPAQERRAAMREAIAIRKLPEWMREVSNKLGL